MTVTEAVTYLKRMHNEENAVTPNWSDSELYSLLEAKSNEALAVIGLVESKNTSTVSVASQSDYSFPSNFVRIRRVWYAGRALKYLSFRQFEARQPTGVSPTGTPREFIIWDNTLTLTPTPTTSAEVITIFGEKQQSSITGTSSTLDIPAVFHHAILDAVLSEMFVKDENAQFADMYQKKWLNIHIPAMREFAKRRRRRGLPTVVIDADSVLETEFGVI